MNKHSIIEQIQAHGAVAAHTFGRYVEVVNHQPVKVTIATPIYMAKEKLRKGDRVAIVDMDENVAFICTIRQVETSRISKKQTLFLDKGKKIRLD